MGDILEVGESSGVFSGGPGVDRLEWVMRFGVTSFREILINFAPFSIAPSSTSRSLVSSLSFKVRRNH